MVEGVTETGVQLPSKEIGNFKIKWQILSSNNMQKIAKHIFFNKKTRMLIWPIQDDRMNMTEKFIHDGKDHTHKHTPLEHDQKCTTTMNNNG